jgi:sphingolipid delta-4 desaturase
VIGTCDPRNAPRPRSAFAPQVTKLCGVDELLKYKVALVVSIQVVGAVVASHSSSWLLWFAWTYAVGGTFNHTLTLGMHELSHNLAFKSMMANRMLGFFANLPLGIPSFMYDGATQAAC